MAFQKIPKDQWDKMTQSEKDWATLEFNKDKEVFRRRLLIASRIIAVFLIVTLVWIWWGQITQVQQYSEIRNQYGPRWACYLCGKENLRQCSCVMNYGGTFDKIEIDQLANDLALQNTADCTMKAVGSDGTGAKREDQINLSILDNLKTNN